MDDALHIFRSVTLSGLLKNRDARPLCRMLRGVCRGRFQNMPLSLKGYLVKTFLSLFYLLPHFYFLGFFPSISSCPFLKDHIV